MMDVGSIITVAVMVIFLWGLSLFIAFEAGKQRGSAWGTIRRDESLSASDLLRRRLKEST